MRRSRLVWVARQAETLRLKKAEAAGISKALPATRNLKIVKPASLQKKEFISNRLMPPSRHEAKANARITTN